MQNNKFSVPSILYKYYQNINPKNESKYIILKITVKRKQQWITNEILGMVTKDENKRIRTQYYIARSKKKLEGIYEEQKK